MPPVSFPLDGSRNQFRTRVKLGQSFMCPCGNEIGTVGPWLAAHWRIQATTSCVKCKQKFSLESGDVTMVLPHICLEKKSDAHTEKVLDRDRSSGVDGSSPSLVSRVGMPGS